MSLKQFLILFIILFFVPIFMGKVSFAPFSNFFQHMSFNGFMTAFSKIFQDDFAFYLAWIKPWIGKFIDWIKSFIPGGIPNLQSIPGLSK